MDLFFGINLFLQLFIFLGLRGLLFIFGGSTYIILKCPELIPPAIVNIIFIIN